MTADSGREFRCNNFPVLAVALAVLLVVFLAACDTTSSDESSTVITTGGFLGPESTENSLDELVPGNRQASTGDSAASGSRALEPELGATAIKKGTTAEQSAAMSLELSDSRLGLETIVDEFLARMHEGSVPRPKQDYEPSYRAKIRSEDPDLERRGRFELELFVEFGKKLDDDPHYIPLFHAMANGYLSCFEKNAGIPPLREFLALDEKQQQEIYEKLGLVGNAMRELEDKCFEHALTFAYIGENEGERLRHLQREYYLKVAREWVVANPNKVVPLPQ